MTSELVYHLETSSRLSDWGTVAIDALAGRYAFYGEMSFFWAVLVDL